MARHHLLFVALGCYLLGPRLLVEATGRQPLTNTNTTRIFYDNSKDYMLLGCFPDGPGSMQTLLNEDPLPLEAGVSADKCAAMTRAANTSFTSFGVVGSGWCKGAKGPDLPGVLTTAPHSFEGSCEMQCRDPAVLDVSCGGTRDSFTWYVFKGKQGYTDLGCYAYNSRSHPGSTELTGTSAGKMTPDECYRLSAAYDFFGLVNGSRCIGFMSLQTAVAAARSESAVDGFHSVKTYSCPVRCTGAASATCGGSSTMQLYARNKPVPQLAPARATPNDYVYLGCVADEEDVVYYDEPKPGQPGLPSMLLTVYNEEYLNISACASAAKRVGKRFFGLQRDICRAGAGLINALRHSATPGACSTHCAPDYVCRGGSRDPLSTSLYVFKNGKDYTSLGCYALRSDRPPLPQLLLDSPKMTPGFCFRKAAAYKFFAVFNGTRCYAGNDLAPSLRHGRGSTGCTTPCGSNRKQTCGGSAAFKVYVNHAQQAVPPVIPLSVGPAGEVLAPVPTPTSTPGDLQRQRLLEGRDAMDPTWSATCMRDWNNTTYPCDGDEIKWESVSSCSNGIVLALDLSLCWLGGTLPTTWGALPGLEGLTSLTLFRTRLTGTLPASWSGLRALQVLSAQINQLTGPLPESWGHMRVLQTVILDKNQLTGTLPGSWGRVKSLQSLSLGNNRLKGPLPASWGNLTGLTGLGLDNNTQLTGTLPPSWGSWTTLQALSLSTNPGLTGTLPCAWSSMGSNATRSPEFPGGNMYRLYLGGTGLKGCYPSAGLKTVADTTDAIHGWQLGSSPVKGVCGRDPGCPPCP